MSAEIICVQCAKRQAYDGQVPVGWVAIAVVYNGDQRYGAVCCSRKCAAAFVLRPRYLPPKSTRRRS